MRVAKTIGCFLLAAAVLGCLGIVSGIRCDVDHGLEPIRSKIAGKIFFVGTAPWTTDEVRVAVIKEFPPRSLQEMLFSDMLNFRQDTVPWEIYLPPGTYGTIVVVWKENNMSWNISDVIGLWGGTFIGDLLIPTMQSVIVPDESSVIDTIDILANLNRVNRDAKITGRITFTGTWPVNTGIVGIGAFIDMPSQGNFIDYYFKNVALDYSVPPFVSSYDYLLRVRSTDTLKYVSVLWIDSDFDLTSIIDIGYYRDPADTSQPGQFVVPKDSTRTGVDIHVKFPE